MSKPILCLDFDGVIHRYDSGWKGADVIPDPPVDGALAFIDKAREHFIVAIFSSRSAQVGGKAAMCKWLGEHMEALFGPGKSLNIMADIEWPTEKPAAFLTIDDRALTFEGVWPSMDELREFKPWNKRPIGASGRFPQGKLDDTDEGELTLAIGYDKLNGVVRLEFGKPVAWMGLPPRKAKDLAEKLLFHARKAAS